MTVQSSSSFALPLGSSNHCYTEAAEVASEGIEDIAGHCTAYWMLGIAEAVDCAVAYSSIVVQLASGIASA